MGTEAAQHDATFRHLTRREDLRGVAGQAAEVIVTRPLAVDNSVIPGARMRAKSFVSLLSNRFARRFAKHVCTGHC